MTTASDSTPSRWALSYFDNPVVVVRERFVAAHGDNRVGRYSRRDRDRRQSLDKRVAGGLYRWTLRGRPARDSFTTPGLPVTRSFMTSTKPFGRLAKPAT